MSPEDVNPGFGLEGYEDLRRHVLGADVLPDIRPPGLVLLLRCGLAGWMRRWPETAGPPPRVSAPAGIGRCPSPPAPEWQSQLTWILAQMTAPHLQPIHHL